MSYLVQKISFIIRVRYFRKFNSSIRKMWYSFLGMRVGKGTVLQKTYITWPHKVSIGNECIIERCVNFKFDGIWQKGYSIFISDRVFIGANCELNIKLKIVIGEDSLIASGCKFIDHDHGIQTGELMRSQHGAEKAILIGKDVWIGCNVIILKGVQIGDGAIVAAGAVVTKSIPPNEIWAGVPAKKVGQRS